MGFKSLARAKPCKPEEFLIGRIVKKRIVPLMLFCLICGSSEMSLMVVRGGTLAIINGQTAALGPGATVSPSVPPSSCRTDTKFPEDYAMLGTNDLLGHHRIRTRSRFDSNFQNDFCVARNGRFPPNSSGVVVATHDAAQPVMFLRAATARGPPWSGDQSLYLFDHALVRPAPHFCTAPPLPEFQFHDSSSVSNTIRLFNHSFMVNRAGVLLVAASFPTKYNPTVHRKELL